MKTHLLLVVLLLVATLGAAVAQDMPGFSAPPKSKTKGKPAAKGKGKGNPNGPILIKGSSRDEEAPPIIATKVRLKNPVIVYYEQAPPGKATQQLIMDEEHLALLRYLTPDELVMRREVYVDGLGNLPLPGKDENKRSM